MRVLLVDGMAYLYRAFYSSNLLRNAKGQPYSINKNSRGESVGALTRYLYLIDQFNQEYPCDEIIICEDAPRDTLYRQQLFAEYKHGRKPPPQDLLDQKGILFGFLRKIGFPVIGLSGYEADDIIGTMSRQFSDDGHHVLIASPDKDMYQLLTNSKIAMIQHNSNTKTQTMLYRDDIHSINGYWPEQVIDLKILSGDSSDNIPGVPGCGYKNSVRILQKFGSIDKLLNIEVSDPIDIQVKNYIINHEDDVEKFRQVLTINREVDINEISKQMTYSVNWKTMCATMERYEVISFENFEALSYSEYLFGRVSRNKEEISSAN